MLPAAYFFLFFLFLRTMAYVEVCKITAKKKDLREGRTSAREREMR